MNIAFTLLAFALLAADCGLEYAELPGDVTLLPKVLPALR